MQTQKPKTVEPTEHCVIYNTDSYRRNRSTSWSCQEETYPPSGQNPVGHNPHVVPYVGRLASGPRLVGLIGSGVRVSASFQNKNPAEFCPTIAKREGRYVRPKESLSRGRFTSYPSWPKSINGLYDVWAEDQDTNVMTSSHDVITTSWRHDEFISWSHRANKQEVKVIWQKAPHGGPFPG